MKLTQQAPAVVLLPVTDERFETYQKAVFEHFEGSDAYEKITDSHITIHPGFTTTPYGMETVRMYLNSQEFQPEVSAMALYAYPSVDNPAVISLAVDIDLSLIRDDIQSILEAYDYSILNDYPPTHITLLRRQNMQSNELPVAVHETVQNLINDLALPSGKLETGPPRIEWYNPPYKLDLD